MGGVLLVGEEPPDRAVGATATYLFGIALAVTAAATL
jgi:hypothetical protein